jgi:hypothetical protein
MNQRSRQAIGYMGTPPGMSDPPADARAFVATTAEPLRRELLAPNVIAAAGVGVMLAIAAADARRAGAGRLQARPADRLSRAGVPTQGRDPINREIRGGATQPGAPTQPTLHCRP